VLKHFAIKMHGRGGNMSRIINQLHAPADLPFRKEPPNRMQLDLSDCLNLVVKVNR
jgi:hypothetical protein